MQAVVNLGRLASYPIAVAVHLFAIAWLTSLDRSVPADRASLRPDQKSPSRGPRARWRPTATLAVFATVPTFSRPWGGQATDPTPMATSRTPAAAKMATRLNWRDVGMTLAVSGRSKGSV